MTSNAVTQTDFYSQNVTNRNQVAKQPNDLQNSFGQLMNQTTKNKDTSSSKVHTIKKMIDNMQADQRNGSSKIKSSEAQEQEEKTKVSAKEVEAPVTKKAKEMQKAIAEELGVSEEDVAKAMEVLGMQNADLLNPNLLSNLVVQLSGETDMLALVTNEDLYASLNKLLQTVDTALSELGEQFSLSPVEMQQILEQLKANPQTKEMMGVAEVLPEVKQLNDKMVEVAVTSDEMPTEEILAEKIPAEKIPKEAVAQEGVIEGDVTVKDKVVTEKVADKLPEAKVTVEKPVTVDGENEETTATTKIMPDAVSKPTDNQAGSNQSSMQGNGLAQEATVLKGTEETNEVTPNPFQNFSNQLSQKLDAVLQNADIPREVQDTERIMRQVMDNMKLHIGGDVTEMEMQLHPASLGTVNLQVAYKNGALTAQFTTQNETVKAAIESQIVQLRENLNEQGIKVEAIEVTIASHEFERNLSQGNGEQGESRQPGKQNRRKAINLNEFGIQGETDLGEAERIAVQLMKENGNTVDFTA